MSEKGGTFLAERLDLSPRNQPPFSEKPGTFLRIKIRSRIQIYLFSLRLLEILHYLCSEKKYIDEKNISKTGSVFTAFGAGDVNRTESRGQAESTI